MSNFKRLMVDAIIVIVALAAGAGTIYAVQAEAGDPIYYRDVDGDGYGNRTAATSSVALSGYVADSTDCNDTAASIHPGATEQCNGIDDNCDGNFDDGMSNFAFWLDADGDTFGTSASTTFACVKPAGWSATSSDCNDGNNAIRPNAAEISNGIDDNCNGQIDENLATIWYRDADNDGYGTPSNTVASTTKPSGYVSASNDCNDANINVHPNATETSNGIDDNCNGQIDENLAVRTWYRDADNDGYGTSGNTISSSTKPSGYVPVNSDCNDANANIRPGVTEIVNDGIDNNCNGLIDESLSTWYRDADIDGYGNGDLASTSVSQPSGYVSNSADCNDGNYNIKPNASEVTDGVDNDCDGLVDENCSTTTWYRDADGDGYGNSGLSTQSCGQPSGYVSNSQDCNDGNNAIRPSASEIKDNLDNDCDGQIDENTNGNVCNCDCDCDCDHDSRSGITCRWDNNVQFSNHGAFTSAWSHYTNCLKSIGDISGREKGQMMKEANQVVKGRVGALNEEIREVRTDLKEIRQDLNDSKDKGKGKKNDNGHGNNKSNGNGKGKKK